MWHLRQVIQLKFCLNSNDLLGHQRARQTQMTTAKQKSNSCKRNCFSFLCIIFVFVLKKSQPMVWGPVVLGLVSEIFLCESTFKNPNHWPPLIDFTLRFGLSFFWHSSSSCCLAAVLQTQMPRTTKNQMTGYSMRSVRFEITGRFRHINNSEENGIFLY